MKIVVLPPYQNKNGFVVKHVSELMENMERKGLITKEEYLIDEGFFIDSTDEARDAEFFATITLGIIKKVKEYANKGNVDAIVSFGSMEPAFFASRQICDIPFVGAHHASLHVASLVGDRCTTIEATDPQAILARRNAKMYDLSHKLVSVRSVGYSSTAMGRLIEVYPRGKRAGAPEVKECMKAIVAQCVAAVEEDRADSIILSCMPLQVFESEVRDGLNEAGYKEVPLICQTAAAVGLAKALVGMKLTQARLAYPRASTKPASLR
jgi:Asp/Glu/hydantoin racemase